MLSDAALDAISGSSCPRAGQRARDRPAIDMALLTRRPQLPLDSDLRGIGLRLDAAWLVEAAGRGGRARPRGAADARPRAIDRLVADSGAGLRRRAASPLRPDGGLDEARFARSSGGDWLDAPVDTDRAAGRAGPRMWRSPAAGRPAPLPEGGRRRRAMACRSTWRWTRLRVSQGIALTDFRGRVPTQRRLERRLHRPGQRRGAVAGAVVPTERRHGGPHHVGRCGGGAWRRRASSKGARRQPGPDPVPARPDGHL